MQRYYFIVEFIPKRANLELLTGRCISVMHGFICKHNILGLGVSFPSWTEKSIGASVAFVHVDHDVLAELRSQSYFQDMQQVGFFRLGAVSAVPSNCKEVRFKRNQTIAKIFAKDSRRRLARLKKRAEARGEPFTPAIRNHAKELDPFHCVAVSSASTDQDFLLHIQKETVNQATSIEFNQYGLSTNQKFSGTVPDLNPFKPNDTR
ncbi:type I-F CRISPR-associated endoribonuclease Cas6/Csy4 [Shewanella sp. FJAT-52076]|uniref:type I-F CRISPR-associated endoribonuclease Cas6/Csy4 n=1 Tax=Shewanella sp. FJAT-52076 TaxID=2864202 RepID=UPI001C658B32|nr:type I-F CRISPR-associated endoribonuclease Cas6/Csy4 [Shewanella sp. FJAT-52076]QYJ75326.1 type I-F CRISPR-associated endoribonuclease Cas6/Csy4 [Shewanella sp. FJAT-52076]